MAKGATHVLGLDIGNDSIKVVELSLTRTGVKLASAPAVVPTPAGAVSGGVVVDPAALAEALREVLSQNHMTTRKVILSVGGDTSVVARVISMPRMTGKELDEAMQWELDRQTPFPTDQVIFDFAPLPTPENAPATENMEVFLAVGQEDMISEHLNAVQGAKLTPLHVDVEPLALGRALVSLPDAEMLENSVVVIDCGASFTGIYIFRKGWPAFLRTIPTAGDSLTDAVREGMETDRERAEWAKRQFADVSQMIYEGPAEMAEESDEGASGMFDSMYEESSAGGHEVAAPPPDSLETIPATEMEMEAPPPPPVAAAPAAAAAPAEELPAALRQARDAVSEAISQRIFDLVTEIGRSLDFYRRQHREEKLSQIVLCGGSAHLKGLAALIGGETGIPTRLANPFEHLDTEGVATPEYLQDLGPNLAVAVGLALRDMLE
ncbi:MAG TPA: type IV pilus assembly protein PilM [Armatimonadota bacterium]|jgi:type IV pilus assembly protein PilM